jgi:hypothetical protein
MYEAAKRVLLPTLVADFNCNYFGVTYSGCLTNDERWEVTLGPICHCHQRLIRSAGLVFPPRVHMCSQHKMWLL